ncbi:hypothetical protein [Paludisphaera borealis]|uniref:Glycosyltransferase RgtA/B/C/D-like domain-containing protein n=1 Tax=Paludisphaera borealis TaxID=1387353 RepID=A0A1U7CTD9_9BACT|nr:hypothetical protein [Paludisphaera borealis]APW62191.1 hypothetical protein BSF38_03723 [Paludisphaera borealis]
MNGKIGLILSTSAVLVGLSIAVVFSGRVPLGVPGEWEWLRVKVAPSAPGLLLAAAAVAGYALYAALGFRSLGVPSAVGFRESVWLAGLAASAVAVQIAIPIGAADEYDLTKWAYVHYFPSSTGYYDVAKRQAMGDPWKFLADYPVWIASQDSLHIGTHPPGLIALHCCLIRAMERSPRTADLLNGLMPPQVAAGFRQLEALDRKPIPRADRAAIYLASLITLLACAGTVVPLYLLARESVSPQVAWAASVLWPLAPAANLFQPDADAAYPLLSASALALASWAARLRGTSGGPTFASIIMAVASGMIMAFGMAFTLAFLPIGLIAALVALSTPRLTWSRKIQVVVWIGVGFLGLAAVGWLSTSANPVVVWRWNLLHHAQFYLEYPRTYLLWLLVNPIELAVAVGLPSAVWCLVGFIGDRRYVPRAGWCALVVLALVHLSGRNMGEVARLWMLFLPPLLTAAGVGLTRLGGGPKTVFATALLVAIATLALQTMIQVVYPV